MQVLSDGGGIYRLGSQPESLIRGNLIHDVALNLGTGSGAHSPAVVIFSDATPCTLEHCEETAVAMEFDESAIFLRSLSKRNRDPVYPLNPMPMVQGWMPEMVQIEHCFPSVILDRNAWDEVTGRWTHTEG